jgi:hypothetical protein
VDKVDKSIHGDLKTPVVPELNPIDSRNTYRPFKLAPRSSAAPVFEVMNCGGPTTKFKPKLIDRNQQFGHVPNWLNGGIDQPVPSKLSLQGAGRATH